MCGLLNDGDIHSMPGWADGKHLKVSPTDELEACDPQQQAERPCNGACQIWDLIGLPQCCLLPPPAKLHLVSSPA